MPIDDRPTVAAPDDDPYLWLEDIEGERALDFVDRQSRLTLEAFGGQQFIRDRDALAAIYDRNDNIPYITRSGGLVYNLWKDAKNPRGIWRRTTLADFAGRSPSGRRYWTSTASPPTKARIGCSTGPKRSRETSLA